MPLNIKKNINLKNYSTWQVGGLAEFFCLPKTIEEIKEALQFVESNKVSYTVIGGGSNVLISDQGIPGLTICLRDYNKYELSIEKDRFIVRACSGVSKSELLKIFLKHKLPPALFLAGLPGDVGGGVVMNAGVAEQFVPREFVEIVDWIEVLRDTGTVEVLKKSDLHWSYRHCEGWAPGIITRVGLSWDNSPDFSILEKVKEANRVRLSKQPLDQPSCGSVFVNPENQKAAQLIDSCGLKGYTVGDAQVSQKHANFIVNRGNATAADVMSVIQHVQKVVLEQKHIQLKTEVVLLGKWQ